MLYLKLETGAMFISLISIWVNFQHRHFSVIYSIFSQLPKLSLISLGILLLQSVKIHWQNGKRYSADGTIMGTKLNHSLRATGAMELYQAGVPEKVLQEHTGHLSLTGLCQYERISGKQHETVSQILAAKGNVT